MHNEMLAKRLAIAKSMTSLFADPNFSRRFTVGATINIDGMISVMPAAEDEDAVETLLRMSTLDSQRIVLVSNSMGRNVYAEYEVYTATETDTPDLILLDGMTAADWLRMLPVNHKERPRILACSDSDFCVKEIPDSYYSA